MMLLASSVALVTLSSAPAAHAYDMEKLRQARGATDAEATDDESGKQSGVKDDQLLVKLKSKAKRSTIQQLNSEIDASIIEAFHGSRTYLVKIPADYAIEDIIEYYESSRWVEHVELNYPVERFAVPDDSKFGQQWNLHNTGSGTRTDADIDAPEAWDMITDCSSVVVAVMDDGIDFSHPDLAANAWINEDEIAGDGIDNDSNGYADDVYGFDFADNDPDISPDLETDPAAGHGTHVAGIIGAAGNNGIGIAGVCWNVKLMSLKIFDSLGGAFIDDIVEASDYAIEMKNRGVNIIVINMSFGSRSFSDIEFAAIKRLRDAGILVTAAAGNSGTDSDGARSTYPASYKADNILAVAASNDRDRLPSFSNYGANSVDIAAPGSLVLSTIAGGSEYESWSGTSMAAPHVAGVAALVAAQDDALEYDQIRAKILNGADPKSALSGKVATGGRLNANGALLASSSLPDITVTDIDASSSKSGETAIITVTVTLRNTGGALSDSSFLDVFIASDPEFDDIVAARTYEVGSIKAGSTQNVGGALTISASSDTFYILAIADFDDLVSEADEDNNDETLEVEIPVTDQDLEASSISVKTRTIKSGSKVVLTVTVKNAGESKITGDVDVNLYLSTDNLLDDSDTLVGEDEIRMTTRATSSVSMSFKVPSGTSAGTYYLIAEVDPDNLIPETNEDNNIVSKAIKIRSR